MTSFHEKSWRYGKNDQKEPNFDMILCIKKYLY